MDGFSFDYIREKFDSQNIKIVKVIDNFEVAVESNGNIYTPSNYTKKKNGRPFNLRGRLIKPTIDRWGYYRCTFSYKLKRKSFYVHRLVAKAFLENYSENLLVNHINGIKTDNRIENLEMCTPKENVKHAFENDLRVKLTRDEKGRFMRKGVV